MNDPNSSLSPATVFLKATEPRFQDHYRRWQGIPSIEVSKRGRVFVNFYGGQGAEVGGNVMVLCVSDNRGETFRSCEMVVEHPDPDCRICDPALWIDPLNRLWVFWTQVRNFNDARFGVWAVTTDNPDAKELVWSPPRRIANGIMLNKPIATSTGEWFFPCALWCDQSGSTPTERHGLEAEQFVNAYVSSDQGQTIALRSHADMPDRSYDESAIVEKQDGTLWMLSRSFHGISESFSTDNGYTWSPGRKSHIEGPCSRFHISRLKSGRLLLINHYQFEGAIDLDDIMHQSDVKSWKGRNNLTALLSEDDGKTWPYTLLLDARNEVSYPDAAQGEDGYIYVTYDRERITQREILMARISEEDILQGKLVSPDSKLRMLVNKATGQPDVH
ncbi:sialidase family protein [uncultured Oscillibacter sp.]|uniref:sialidase family protein n=1 Tax=uncultured Oscillibacter sp. TaxID=876091 RepID=UPI0028062B61|nr:sialidase family protein [uncultured Oscillibacter sp.]